MASDGQDSHSGFLPEEAMLTIQEAIEKAIDEGVTKVYVAEGSYTPGNGLNPQSDGAGIRLDGSASGMTISGGWDSDFSDHSGVTTLDGEGNLLHVVALEGGPDPGEGLESLTFERFTITGGMADGPYPDERGGGMYIQYVSESFLRDLIITGNETRSFGGGIYIYGSSSNRLDGELLSNSAERGGGMYMSFASQNFVEYTITGNIAEQKSSSPGTYNGGGLYLSYSHSNGIFCNASNNSAGNDGGGLYFWGADDNNLLLSQIQSNTAGSGGHGGGLYEDHQSSGTDTSDCNISGNSPDNHYIQPQP